MNAADYDDLPAMKVLYRNGVIAASRGIISIAARNMNYEMMRWILYRFNFSIPKCAIVTAIKSESVHIVKLLLDRYKGPLPRNSMNYAAGNADKLMLHVLRARYPNAKCTQRIIEHVAEFGTVLGLKFILKNIDVNDISKNTRAVAIATQFGDFAVVKKLIKCGFPVHDSFYIACENGHFNIVKYLLENIESVYNDFLDGGWETASISCIINRRYDILGYLMTERGVMSMSDSSVLINIANVVSNYKAMLIMSDYITCHHFEGIDKIRRILKMDAFYYTDDEEDTDTDEDFDD